MDIWRASVEKIMRIAEVKANKRAIEVLKPSGLYAWVLMDDGTYTTVYEAEL